MDDLISFFKSLKQELEVLPLDIYEYFLHPYRQALESSADTNPFQSLIVSWSLQALLSVGVFYLLLRLAKVAPKNLSKVQQSLLYNTENNVASRIITVIFWLLKTNVGWVLLLGGTWLSIYLLPDNWHVYRYIGFWGTLIALAKGIHVIFEWLLDRAISSSGQYISPALVAKIETDALATAWMVSVVWSLVWGTYQIEGFYSHAFANALAVCVTWGVFVRLLAAYSDYLDNFAQLKLRVFEDQLKTLKAKTSILHPLLRPVFFAMAQCVDILLSINQRLLYFDSYRALSVRILRLRLESKEDKEKETEEEVLEPDQSYSSWLLREVDVTDNWIEAPSLDHLYQPIKIWSDKQSEDNVLYIIGDSGSGKTSLARHLEKNWTDGRVKYAAVPAKSYKATQLYALLSEVLEIPEISSMGDLIEQTKDMEPTLLVIDDAHNLFVSDVGKLEAYGAFISFLNAYIENVFWVVIMNTASWNYLDCVFNRELRVSHLYSMQKWTPGEIRKLILSRHKGSRRKLQYDEMLLSAVAPNEYSSVRAADSRIFNLVWEQSQGNPMHALHLWNSAARSKDNIVEIGVPQKPDSSILKSLSADSCFILAAIVTHESMTSGELVVSTNYSEAIVRHALKQGINLGILERSSDRRYSVVPLWQNSLTVFLTSKNMIWRM